jgi:hypothetical protein
MKPELFPANPNPLHGRTGLYQRLFCKKRTAAAAQGNSGGKHKNGRE